MELIVPTIWIGFGLYNVWSATRRETLAGFNVGMGIATLFIFGGFALALGATWYLVGVTALMAVTFLVLAIVCFRYHWTSQSLLYLLLSVASGVLFSITINS